MFGRRLWTDTISTEDGINKLRTALAESDAVIIGAGAGLSTSAGFTYTGERFQKYFHDFAEKYSFRDMYSGGFYSFDGLEEYWAYWSRYIMVNRYMNAPKPVYQELFSLIKDKDYFVLTTNVDHCFQKAGFDKKRLFYTQGDYGLFQCSAPCHQKTYDNEETVRQMVESQGYTIKENGEMELPDNVTLKMTIPSELVPHCPICGKPVTMNLRCDDTFVEDDGWHNASERYSLFLRRHQNVKTLFLELGTGMNTPGIVKFSFWRMVHEWPDATYA
ncbi:MAG: Sir2 silent information regulator family NAD-dependent deacetylase, partial [Lachnospiraceae bacterium]|nr:Sir2 silent information regulator family NAD-dependent deacetylase [Lachnospiraceae bacterium]